MRFLNRNFFIAAFVILYLGIMNISASCSKNNSLMSSPSPYDTLKTYLALGDSYTIGQSVNENETYPAQTVAILKTQNIDFSSPEIIATRSEEHTSELQS